MGLVASLLIPHLLDGPTEAQSGKRNHFLCHLMPEALSIHSALTRVAMSFSGISSDSELSWALKVPREVS